MDERLPRTTEAAAAERAARQAREAAALRDNLRRRKSQARARAAQENASPPETEAHASGDMG